MVEPEGRPPHKIGEYCNEGVEVRNITEGQDRPADSIPSRLCKGNGAVILSLLSVLE